MKDDRNRLYLMVPTMENLKIRKEYLKDPKTMSYNQEGTNDGTIDFKEEMWEDWLPTWTQSKERFFAYLVRKEDNQVIGDVAFHYDSNWEGYLVEILIVASERGKGYGEEGLELLCSFAFTERNINCLVNHFPSSRVIALNVHEKVGFVKRKENDSFVTLVLEQKDWYHRK